MKKIIKRIKEILTPSIEEQLLKQGIEIEESITAKNSKDLLSPLFMLNFDSKKEKGKFTILSFKDQFNTAFIVLRKNSYFTTVINKRQLTYPIQREREEINEIINLFIKEMYYGIKRDTGKEIYS